MKHTTKLLAFLLALVMLFSMTACGNNNSTTESTETPNISTSQPTDDTNPSTSTTPETETTTPTTPEPNPNENLKDPSKLTVTDLNHTLWNGTDAFIVVNNGKPFFTDEEITTKSFERYAELDALGRCGVTFACVGKDLMPTEDRESISSVYPSGWKTNGKSNNKQYDFVDGTYVYNRCHLIGFQLTGENANKQNLITGTRYLNINGMLALENMIADAVRENELHVMYRVTPIFAGDNLLPEGVLMEGYSVEDNGEAIEFCVFAFNVQPGVEFNYATGENWLASEQPSETQPDNQEVTQKYVLNTNSKKFHNPDCSSAAKISANNREEKECTRDSLIDEGYAPCGVCKP